MMMASSQSLEEATEHHGTRIAHCTYLSAQCTTHTQTHTRARALLCNEGQNGEGEKRETGLTIDDKQSRSSPANIPLGFCSC